MKLLEVIRNVSIDDVGTLNDILFAIETRKDTVEMQEPDSDYEFFYEKWEEKFDDISDIYDSLEELVDEIEEYYDNDEEINKEDRKRLEKDLEDIVDAIENHQFEYGGLKRIKI